MQNLDIVLIKMSQNRFPYKCKAAQLANQKNVAESCKFMLNLKIRHPQNVSECIECMISSAPFSILM